MYQRIVKRTIDRLVARLVVPFFASLIAAILPHGAALAGQTALSSIVIAHVAPTTGRFALHPVSHHLQQTTYIATGHPRSDHPELGLEILGHFSPEQVRYEKERTTRLESFADTLHYIP